MPESSHKAARECALALLARNGVISPSKIDVVALAIREGLTVTACDLRDAEGYLLRCGDTGDILVRGNDLTTPRARFTVAHELGHWLLHKDRMIVALHGALGEVEGAANAFAAELLMPSIMMPKRLHLHSPCLWQPKAIAPWFNVSLSAAALRYAEVATGPVVVVLTNSAGIVTASLGSANAMLRVPRGTTVSPHTRVSILRRIGDEDAVPMDVAASEWFPGASGTVQEHSLWLKQQKLGVTIIDLLHPEPPEEVPFDVDR